MRILAFAFALPLLVVAALVLPAAAVTQQTKQVEVTNLPEVQDVFVTNPRFQLVGFTPAIHTGVIGGPFGVTHQCQLEFGAGTRICSSREILETMDPPEGLAGLAWVRPIAVGPGGVTGFGIDESGAHEVRTCSSWTSNNGRGLTIDAQGQFLSRDCNAPRAIACCALVP